MSSILWALWTVARSLVALLLLLLCLPFSALALAQFGPVTALLPFLVSFRATDSARAVLAAVVALTIVGFVLPLVVSGYPGAARPHVSRLAHGLIPVRIGAIVWRLVVLFWLVPVAILVGGEVVAAFMPHDRLPSPAADIARVAGFRLADIGLRLPAHADPGARLLVVGLWGVAAWGIANGAARLVRGVHLLHLLGSPAYADTAWCYRSYHQPQFVTAKVPLNALERAFDRVSRRHRRSTAHRSRDCGEGSASPRLSRHLSLRLRSR